VAKILRDTGTDVVVSYLPVGSEKATRWYVEQVLEAGCAFVNCVPVFIASNPEWERRFAERGLPIIGDDIKSQVGATIVHRVLTDLFRKRGVRLDRTYQLNFGGNTDFLNMLERERLQSKKISKTQAVTSQLGNPMKASDVHVGPSDHVPWLADRKWCYIRMEGTTFGNVPLNCELKMEVWDSPNSAGVVIDAVRCAKLALDRGVGGAVLAPSSYFMKSPPQQFTDDEAHELVEAFIRGDAEGLPPAASRPPGTRPARAVRATRPASREEGRMIEAVKFWNEPNNKSHWDLELDPDWSAYARMVRMASDAVRAEAPSLTQVLGGISPIDARFMTNLRDRGVLAGLDAVAVHGFPLDWNHWQIDEWPRAHRRDRGGDAAARVGDRSGRVHLRRGGGAGVRRAPHRRAADRPRLRASSGIRSTTCREPGRRLRATGRPRARATTGTSTWAFCARTARPSWPRGRFAEHGARMGICQWFHFEDHRLDDAVRWLRRLGVRHVAHRSQLGRQLPARRSGAGSTGRCARSMSST
jgi:hypothetical protein